MARLRALLLMVLALWGGAAVAKECTQYSALVNGNFVAAIGWHETKKQACVAKAGWYNNPDRTYTVIEWENTCVIEECTPGGCSYILQGNSYATRNGDYCEEEKCQADTLAHSGIYPMPNGSKKPVLFGCHEECKVYFLGYGPVGKSVVEGQLTYFFEGSYTRTGEECRGDEAAVDAGTEEIPENSCPDGQVGGQVNDKFVCVNSDYPDGTDKSKGQAQSTTTSDSTTVTNPDGSVTTTTTTTTTYSDGSKEVTTTTTTTNPDGSSSSTTSRTTSKGPNGGNLAGKNAGTDDGEGEGDGGDDGDGDEQTECQKNPMGEGCAGTPSGQPTGYEAKGDTFEGTLDGLRAQMLATPLGTAVGGFFTVSNGGTCPVAVWEIPYIEASVNFDVMCSQFALDALAIMRIVMLLGGAFFAFRVAVE